MSSPQGATAQLRYYFDNFGLRTQGSWQTQDGAFADYTENFISQLQEGIESRQGYQTKITGVGGYGAIDYSYIDFENSLIQEKLLIDTSLHRIQTGTLNITYTGAATRAVVTLLPVAETHFALTIYVNNTAVSTINLGTGLESSPMTMATLASTIDALADFSATVTGTSTVPAAFADITSSLSIPSSYTKTIEFLYPEEVDTILDAPLDGLATSIQDGTAVNVSWVNHKGLVILTDGTRPKVYDGSTLYYAGLPTPGMPLYTILPGTDADSDGDLSDDNLNGTYTYYVTYEYIDFQGKVTESPWSEPVVCTVVDQKLSFELPTIRSDAGFNTKHAKVNGAQTPVLSRNTATITVDTGHQLRRGDWAYFYNSYTGIEDYRGYTIESVTDTTITIRTTTDVTVTDNLIISNNLRIMLWRSEESETTRVLLVAMTNDPTVPSVTYVDSDPDVTDLAVFSGTLDDVDAGTTASRRDRPPEADYCTSYRGTLVLAKDLFIYWSDDREPQINNSGMAFDVAQFLGSFNKKITALQTSESALIVLQTSAITAYTTTNLNAADIVETQISTKIGCVGQYASTRIGSRSWFISKSGVYELQNGELTLNKEASQEDLISAKTGLGGAITNDIPHFFDNYKSYAWDRAGLGTDVLRNYLFVHLPIEPTPIRTGDTSDLLVYELNRSRWYLWKGIDISGGTLSDSNLDFFFTTRSYGKNTPVRFNKLLRDKTDLGYRDHLTAINRIYETKWDGIAGTPNSLEQKIIQQLKLYSINASFFTPFEHNPTFDISVYKDYSNVLHTTLSMGYQDLGTEWGFMWNNEPIGGYKSVSEKRMLVQETAEAIKLRISNAEPGVNSRLTGWEIKYLNRPAMMKG